MLKPIGGRPMKALNYFALTSSIFLTSLSVSAWDRVFCQEPGATEFLLIEQTLPGKIRIETDQTQSLVKGLECLNIQAKEPFFLCQRYDGDTSAVFRSQIRIERGYPLETYEYTERELYIVNFDYNYFDGQNYKALKKEWKFLTSNCQWN
jgi:hypothetical protein